MQKNDVKTFVIGNTVSMTLEAHLVMNTTQNKPLGLLFLILLAPGTIVRIQ